MKVGANNNMDKSRVVKIAVLKETKFLSLYDAEYVNKAGKIKHWIISSRKNYETLKAQFFQGKKEEMDAVVIVAVHIDSKKLVMIKQFRVPLNDYVYELPAGLVDKGESMETSSIRELREETGLTLDKIDYNKTKSGLYASAGMTDESLCIVYCTCSGNISLDNLEEDEEIQIILVSKLEAADLLRKKIKMDVRAYLALQSFAYDNKLND